MEGLSCRRAPLGLAEASTATADLVSFPLAAVAPGNTLTDPTGTHFHPGPWSREPAGLSPVIKCSSGEVTPDTFAHSLLALSGHTAPC